MTEFVKCPFCAEEIKPEAKICKHCGKELKVKNTILTVIKNEILKSDTKWKVRDSSDDIIHFLYVKKEEKASCTDACCLGCLFLPAGIIYALLGGKKGYERQISVIEKDGKIELSGDAYYILMVYKKLIRSKYKDSIIENDEILNAKKWSIFLKK